MQQHHEDPESEDAMNSDIYSYVCLKIFKHSVCTENTTDKLQDLWSSAYRTGHPAAIM